MNSNKCEDFKIENKIFPVEKRFAQKQSYSVCNGIGPNKIDRKFDDVNSIIPEK